MNIGKILINGVLWLSLSSLPLAFAEDANIPPTERFQFNSEKQHRMEKRTREIYKQLDLTDAQKKQLEENKRKMREKHKALYAQLRSYHQTLDQELMKLDLNMAKINEIEAQINSVRSQLDDDRLNSILEVRQILTRDQFSKFLSSIVKYRAEHSGNDKR